MALRRSLPDLAKSEWNLMDALWSRGQGTATDLQGDLQETQGWAYSTVKTMLDRLVEKGYVKTRRIGNVYEYTPKVKRGAAVTRVIDDLTERILEGSVAPFLSRLIERRALSRQEVDELRGLLDGYTEEPQNGPTPPDAQK
jgi:predicted transcriptional regulator